MIEIQPVERVEMSQRIDQIRRRIASIEEKIGINTADFQATLEREIARQAKVPQPQAVSEMQQLPGATQPVNENDAANSAKVAQALREAEKIEAAKNSSVQKKSEPAQNYLPGRINPQTPPKIDRVEVPDTELQIPERDEKNSKDTFSLQTVEGAVEYASTEDLLAQAAEIYGVDPRLVKAIAIAESDMNQNEISDAGAIGVMQLMPETAAGLGVNPYDEAENIDGGTRFLKQMLDTFDGNVPLAVAAYNAGPGAVQKYGGIPPYSETQNYVGRVMDLFR